ncbi:MAG: diacylglycerol kinase family protein [Saprospiraceae bacterium]
MSNQPKQNRIQKRISSFKYAFNGIIDLFKTQINARIHAFFILLVIGGGFFFNISKTEWFICIISMAMVLAAEAMNTALEHLTDLVSPEYHELAGKAKDAAAAAVLILAIAAAIIGFIVFWNPFLDFIF